MPRPGRPEGGDEVKRRILFLAMGASLALLCVGVTGLVIGQQGIAPPPPVQPVAPSARPQMPTEVRPTGRAPQGRIDNVPVPPTPIDQGAYPAVPAPLPPQ